MKELVEIQSRLNAPKNQFNKFGGYTYRNLEDILQAVKPILRELNCELTISDEIVFIEGRFYVKATAVLTNAEGETKISNAYAREEEIQKGMNLAQITGSTSSYARKYALNGLFAIDDNKDPDATNTHGKEETKKEEPKPTPKVTSKKPAPSVETPSVTIEEVIDRITSADSKEVLKAIYSEFKGTEIGKSEEFRNAIKNHPKYA